MNPGKHIYFAGGGTGGHIYPALAVAQELLKTAPSCKVTFFCSERPIDARILSHTNFRFISLPVMGFSKNPYQALLFFKMLFSAKRLVRRTILADNPDKAVLFSVGGFVSAAAVLAAGDFNMPIAMLNIDAVPGKANKFFARFAEDIFVQFEKTRGYFGLKKRKVTVTGCPLRPEFFSPDKVKAIESLGLNPKRKILLVTGASGGAANINNVIGFLLDRLENFASDWQIVHLTGIAHYDTVRTLYKNVEIAHKILDYSDDMPNLLAAAEIVIGRAGAMSVAEFAASGTPAICLPYPYHCDRHQRLNAQFLVDNNCGVIVDDLCDTEKTAKLLWPVLCELMSDEKKLRQMTEDGRKLAHPQAANQIAQKLLSY